MNGYQHLFIPGPTNVPEPVRQAMNLPMEDMRAPDFPGFVSGLLADLKKVYRMEGGRVFVFPSSGTGAWESAIQNTLRPGDKVLMSRFGQFSLLWVDMAERLGLDVELCEVEWGKGVPVEAYARILEADKESRDQGGLRHPERDGDGRDLGYRRLCAARSMPVTTRRCFMSTG